MNAARPARFITLEGGEGAGKSTHARRLSQALFDHGIENIVTREPGGSPGAEDVRRLLVQGDVDRWDPIAETLLLFAARRDHILRTIEPALSKNRWVICDRFTDSTYAYQGVGRELDRETIGNLHKLAIGDFAPDLTLVLDVSPATGLLRTSTRAMPLFDPAMKDPDSPEAKSALNRRKEARFERFGKTFHERLRQAFLEIAKREPTRCVVVDATDVQDRVAAVIWGAVCTRLGIE
ncbi:MAG: dTMP kinase [Alphaproteobacteria bacterium]|jgi:dTMP kinase